MKTNIDMQTTNTFSTTEAITQFIFLAHEPQLSDVIFCFGTSYTAPLDRVAQLYHEGFARSIVLTGGPNKRLANQAEYSWGRRYLGTLDIPPHAIIGENRSSNTLENVLFGLEALPQSVPLPKLRRAILVTKTYHARRAYMTACKHFPAHVELLSCPALVEEREITADSWWQTELGCQTVMAEVERIGLYYRQGMIGDF